MLKFLKKLWYCKILKRHDWRKEYSGLTFFGDVIRCYKCKICRKRKFKSGPFPPEHVNCKCNVKEGNKIKIELELKEVKKGNIHRIISKRYDSENNLMDKQSVGYIESRLADLVKFREREF